MATYTFKQLNEMERSRPTKTRAPQSLDIKIVASEATETIFAEPDNGNVFLGIPGDEVTWTCNAPFSIEFFDLTGQGAELKGEHCSDGTAFTFKVKLKQQCTFFKYIVTVGKLVLDPYIGTDH